MYSHLLSFLKRPILKEVSWYTFGQIGVQVFAFLGVIVTARYLGPTNLGLYSFVQNYLGAFMAVSGSIDFYFTWKIAKSDTQLETLKESFGYKLYITSFITLLGVSIAWIILPKDVAILATVLFTPLILSSTSGFYSFAIANKKAKVLSVMQVVTSSLLFFIKIILVYIQAPLIFFVATNALEGVLLAIFLTSYFFLQKEIRISFKKFPFPTFFETIRFMHSIKMTIVLLILWQLIIRIDQLVIATFSNAYSLGLYAAAVRIAEIPNVFSGILYTVLVSRIALLEKKDKENSKKDFKKIFFLYFILGSFFALVIVVTAPFLIYILYGQKFLEAVPILRAYALSIPGSFILTYSFSVFGVQNKPKQQVLIFGFGVIVNIALIYLLSPYFGLIGSALATSISYNFLAYLFFRYSR